MVNKRRLSPIRTISERSAKVKRSRLVIRNISKDSINYNRDVFGFKPFASKQIIIMASKEGDITCEYNYRKYDKIDLISDELYSYIIEIIDDILDKVDEVAVQGLTEKIDSGHGNDFEVLGFPKCDSESKYCSEGKEILDTIDENDVTETMLSAGVEDVMHIIEEDSDGLVNDTHLDIVDIARSPSPQTDSSNNRAMKMSGLTMSSSGDQLSNKDVHDRSESARTLVSSDSKSTLIMPSNEEISVESLLKYLRKRNAAYNYMEVADID